MTAAIILLCLVLFLAGLVLWWMRGKPRLEDTTEAVGEFPHLPPEMIAAMRPGAASEIDGGIRVIKEGVR